MIFHRRDVRFAVVLELAEYGIVQGDRYCHVSRGRAMAVEGRCRFALSLVGSEIVWLSLIRRCFLRKICSPFLAACGSEVIFIC
jgi:hypothetical protein